MHVNLVGGLFHGLEGVRSEVDQILAVRIEVTHGHGQVAIGQVDQGDRGGQVGIELSLVDARKRLGARAWRRRRGRTGGLGRSRAVELRRVGRGRRRGGRRWCGRWAGRQRGRSGGCAARPEGHREDDPCSRADPSPNDHVTSRQGRSLVDPGSSVLGRSARSPPSLRSDRAFTTATRPSRSPFIGLHPRAPRSRPRAPRRRSRACVTYPSTIRSVTAAAAGPATAARTSVRRRCSQSRR